MVNLYKCLVSSWDNVENSIESKSLRRFIIPLLDPISNIASSFGHHTAHYRIQIENLGRVQSMLASFLLCRINITKSLLTHAERLEICRLESLDAQRTKLTLSFSYKIVIDKVDFPELISLSLSHKFPPRSTRQNELLSSLHGWTNIRKYTVVNRIMENKYMPVELNVECSY